jgi:hypothetical protein
VRTVVSGCLDLPQSAVRVEQNLVNNWMRIPASLMVRQSMGQVLAICTNSGRGTPVSWSWTHLMGNISIYSSSLNVHSILECDCCHSIHPNAEVPATGLLTWLFWITQYSLILLLFSPCVI